MDKMTLAIVARPTIAGRVTICDEHDDWSAVIDPEPAARIVACVNACAGVSNPADLMAALALLRAARDEKRATEMLTAVDLVIEAAGLPAKES